MFETVAHAIDYMGFDRVSPTRGVKRFKKELRTRWLDRDELARFIMAVDAPETNPTIAD